MAIAHSLSNIHDITNDAKFDETIKCPTTTFSENYRSNKLLIDKMCVDCWKHLSKIPGVCCCIICVSSMTNKTCYGINTLNKRKCVGFEFTKQIQDIHFIRVCKFCAIASNNNEFCPCFACLQQEAQIINNNLVSIKFACISFK